MVPDVDVSATEVLTSGPPGAHSTRPLLSWWIGLLGRGMYNSVNTWRSQGMYLVSSDKAINLASEKQSATTFCNWLVKKLGALPKYMSISVPLSLRQMLEPQLVSSYVKSSVLCAGIMRMSYSPEPWTYQRTL